MVSDVKNQAKDKKAEVDEMVTEGMDKVKKLEVIAQKAVDEAKKI